LRQYIVENKGGKSMTPFERLISGGIAGMVSVAVSYPWDFVRGRLTTQGEGTIRQYKGIMDAFRTIAKEEGVATLYRGVGVSVVGIFPYMGTNFAVYGTMREKAAASLGVTEPNLPGWVTFLIGGIAGASAQTVAYPFDLLRRQIQVEGFGTTSTPAEANAPRLANMSIPRAFAHIVKTEGSVTALYRGLVPNYLKVFPTMAVNFWVYEQCKKFFAIAEPGTRAA
jgi:solute carrier family 25 (mitochondrial phosphate transporter), member 23/24/25/41